jgi:hypothetical protein
LLDSLHTGGACFIIQSSIGSVGQFFTVQSVSSRAPEWFGLRTESFVRDPLEIYDQRYLLGCVEGCLAFINSVSTSLVKTVYRIHLVA